MSFDKGEGLLAIAKIRGGSVRAYPLANWKRNGMHAVRQAGKPDLHLCKPYRRSIQTIGRTR